MFEKVIFETHSNLATASENPRLSERTAGNQVVREVPAVLIISENGAEETRDRAKELQSAFDLHIIVRTRFRV